MTRRRPITKSETKTKSESEGESKETETRTRTNISSIPTRMDIPWMAMREVYTLLTDDVLICQRTRVTADGVVSRCHTTYARVRRNTEEEKEPMMRTASRARARARARASASAGRTVGFASSSL